MPTNKKRKASQSTEKSDDTDVSPSATPQLKKRKKSTVQYDPVSYLFYGGTNNSTNSISGLKILYLLRSWTSKITYMCEN